MGRVDCRLGAPSLQAKREPREEGLAGVVVESGVVASDHIDVRCDGRR
jgi:hypothetical protein